VNEAERKQIEEIAERIAQVVDQTLGTNGPPDLIRSVYDALLTKLVRQRRNKVAEAKRAAARLERPWNWELN
jgi:hypothetical protein